VVRGYRGPLDPEKVMGEIGQAAERMPEEQSRAYMLAYADVGYLVTLSDRGQPAHLLRV
jgi:hypothetical protein